MQKSECGMQNEDRSQGASFCIPHSDFCIPLEPRRLLSAAGTGLLATYYNNPTFTGTTVTRTDRAVSFDWGRGSPAAKIAPDTFAARWTGRVKAAFSEKYIFDVPVNDGVRLWVNHRLLIDRWNNTGASDHSGTIQLRAGKRYDIQLEYRERAGDASVALRWSSPSTPQQLVPRKRLYPTAQNLRSKIDHAFEFAGQQLIATVQALPNENAFPSITGADGKWKTVDLRSWDAGYFGGAMWQMYARTRDRDRAWANLWANLATRWTTSLAPARNDGDDLSSRF